MSSNTINKINKFLLILLAIIFLLVIVISLLYFLFNANTNKNRYRKNENPEIIQSNIENSVFSDFGRLRTFTADSTQIPIIIKPFLSYKTENSFLYEELCQKQRKIKTIILQYFSNKTKNELYTLGEENIKLQILDLINIELSMGKIENLYFEEYIFLE